MTGISEFSDVLLLLDRVPRPPGAQGWRGATSGQLERLANRIGFSLPESCRSWLSVCNGLLAGPGGLYGVDTREEFLDIELVLQSFPEWVAKQWLPIAGDGNGNHYVVDASQAHIDLDAVFFVDTAEDPDLLTYIVASTLPNFLSMLLGRELGDRRWPFDRSYMLATDPSIAAVEPASLLPWSR